MKGRGRNAKVRKRRRKERNRERLARAMRPAETRGAGQGPLAQPLRVHEEPEGGLPPRRVFEGRFRGGLCLRIVFSGEEIPWSGNALLTREDVPDYKEPRIEHLYREEK